MKSVFTELKTIYWVSVPLCSMAQWGQIIFKVVLLIFVKLLFPKRFYEHSDSDFGLIEVIQWQARRLGFSIEHYLIFWINIPIWQVKFSAVLDWINCHSKFITMPCWNKISCGIKGLQKVWLRLCKGFGTLLMELLFSLVSIKLTLFSYPIFLACLIQQIIQDNHF